MKLLSIVLLVASAACAQTLVAHVATGSTNANTFTTTSITSTGANFLLVALTSIQGVTVTFSDSKSNTWTKLNVYSVSGDTQTAFYYVNGAPTVGSSHTFTATCTTCYPTIAAYAYSGMLGTSGVFDKQNGNTSVATSLQTGSITPTQNGELIVTALGGGGTSISVDSSMSIIDNFTGVGGHNYSEAVATLTQGTAAAINPTWSWTGASNTAAPIASFKAAAASSSPTMPPAIRLAQLLGFPIPRSTR